jgi:hypothetical protein
MDDLNASEGTRDAQHSSGFFACSPERLAMPGKAAPGFHGLGLPGNPHVLSAHEPEGNRHKCDHKQHVNHAPLCVMRGYRQEPKHDHRDSDCIEHDKSPYCRNAADRIIEHRCSSLCIPFHPENRMCSNQVLLKAGSHEQNAQQGRDY